VIDDDLYAVWHSRRLTLLRVVILEFRNQSLLRVVQPKISPYPCSQRGVKAMTNKFPL
jgi:hypothetical protein